MTPKQAREELSQYQPELGRVGPGYAAAYAAQVNWTRKILRLLKRDGKVEVPPPPNYQKIYSFDAMWREICQTKVPPLEPLTGHNGIDRYAIAEEYANMDPTRALCHLTESPHVAPWIRQWARAILSR